MFLTGQATSAEKTFGQISFCTCLTDVWAVKIAQPEPYLTQRLDLVSVAHYTTMVRRRKLSEADRGRAVAWIQSGFTYRTIAGRLGVSPSVICRLKQRLQTTGRLKDRSRPGRPRLTDVRTDRFIVRQALTKRTNTANRIRNLVRVTANLNVSKNTVRRRLRAAGLSSRVPARRPRLTPAHKAARQAWSARHLRWTRRQWDQVLFSDESKFNLLTSDRRIHVWRRQGERFHQDCVQQVAPHGGGSVMVWGGFSAQFRTPLYHIQGHLTGIRYRDEILRPLVVPLLRRIGPQALLQDDNAPIHRARVVNDFLQRQGIQRMDWPACSPDMNPIENIWDQLYRRVRENHPPPQNVQNLLGYLTQEWQNLPQQVFRRHVQSMRRRCTECFNKQGGFTHY